MILEITDVRREPDQNAYRVTGKVGSATRSVLVDEFDVDVRLEQLGSKRPRSGYQLRDLAPFVAWLATHQLSEAFRS